MKICLYCKSVLVSKSNIYCNNKCQAEFQFDAYIQQWQSGVVSGNRGISTYNLSRHLRKYLLLKYSNSCSQCGWSVQNPYTKTVPLEVNHVDGDFSNNQESNLELLCPNCHSLTHNFRNLNRCNGRSWRKRYRT